MKTSRACLETDMRTYTIEATRVVTETVVVEVVAIDDDAAVDKLSQRIDSGDKTLVWERREDSPDFSVRDWE